MIKAGLIIIIFSCCILVGVIIKNHLLSRVKICEEFEILINEIRAKICFLKADKNIILSEFSEKYSYAKQFVNEYLSGGQGCSNVLKDDENSVINELLSSIGKRDMDGELSNLQYYEKVVLTMKNACKENYDKYGMFSIKMAIILGTLITIILI